ncbi:MAG: hypothetical protein CME60_14180 [Halobacteriovoraceae bacterium]|nr:hypothetical protein [Halobacteriovoraceae bacterium]
MKKVLVLTTLLSITQVNAAGGKVIDLLLSETGLMRVLAKSGFEKANARAAQSQIELAIKSLMGDSEVVPKAALLQAIGEIENTPANREIKIELAKVLNKEGNEVTKDDLVSLLNNLVLLAGVKGSLVTACGECAAGPLAAEGVTVALKEITDESILELINKNVIPDSPRKLNQFISDRMERLGLGDFSKVSSNVVSEGDKEALAIFLAMADKSSPATATQRKFIEAVFNFSKGSGDQVDLFSPSNPHKFWNSFSNSDMDNDLLAEMTEVLNRAADDTSDLTQRKDAFYSVLNKRAEAIEDPKQRDIVLAKVKSIEEKSCFFAK